MRKFLLMLPLMVLYACGSSDYKDYCIVGNDTIAEIFIPKESNDGALILWPKGEGKTEEELIELCLKMEEDDECIRKEYLGVNWKADLYIYKHNPNYKTEKDYMELGGDCLYRFNYCPPINGNKEGGRLETLQSILFTKFVEFDEGKQFSLNGKLVKVVNSSQLYVCFYTPEKLTEGEAVLIKELTRKYPHTFSIFADDKPLLVETYKRTTYYFFDNENSDFYMGSIGNYMNITGNTISNFDTESTSNTNEIENIIQDGKTIEDYFNFK